MHSITYYEKQSGRDEWGNPKHDVAIEVKNVRFDAASTFSRSVGEDNISINGVVFVDCKHSSPIPNFKDNSKITFNGRDMVIHKVIPCYHPESSEIHHYELDVV